MRTAARGVAVALGALLAALSVAAAQPAADGAAVQPLALHGECGRNLRAVASPATGEVIDELLAVDALSADDAWAVGHTYYADRPGDDPVLAPGTSGTLVQRWDGTSWSLVDSPDVPGAYANILHAVSARSADDVWAAGEYDLLVDGAFVPQPLLLHWDGSDWTIMPAPGLGDPESGSLWGLLALAADDVWAVGGYKPDGVYAREVTRPLILHYDGEDWEVVPSPVPDGEPLNAGLGALAATGPDDIWAVGGYRDPVDYDHFTMAQHWDGQSWRIVDTPNPPGDEGTENDLHDVVARARDDVWAVGAAGMRTLAVHWDGRSWEQVRSPSPGIGAALTGLTVLPSGQLLMVGNYYNPRSEALESFGLRLADRGWRWLRTDAEPGAFTNRVEAVAAAGGRQWAVGYAVAETDGGEGSVSRAVIQSRCAR